MGEIEVAGNYGEYACVDAAGEISDVALSSLPEPVNTKEKFHFHNVVSP